MSGDESTRHDAEGSGPESPGSGSGSGSGSSELDLEAVRLRVLSDIARERGVSATLRNLPTEVRFALAMAAIGLVFAAFFSFIPWALAHYPYVPAKWRDLGWGRAWKWNERILALVMLGAVLLVALVRRALRPLHVVATRSADVWVLALAFIAPFMMPVAMPQHEPEPARQYVVCFVLGLALGGLLLLLLRTLDRSVHADRARAVVAVGTAGFATALALQLACPWKGPLHHLSCHAPIGLALAGVYALFVRFSKR
ncbi:hypothetical protein [Pendulispora albinea]|uniref:DUF1109 domain-containing protein n=1 Tax=Pendulispora albinea TaxID=2741071 RepID=A0ABZ2LRR1_9BACT